MNLSDAIDRYIQVRQAKCAKSTSRCDANNLRHMLAHIGNVKMRDLNRDMMIDYFYGPKGRINHIVRGKPLESSTFNAERGRIAAFLLWCVDEGYMSSTPLRGVERRRVGTRERLRLTPEQMIELIERTEYPRDRALIALGCNTGLRAHALSALRVGDVDLDRGYIRSYSSKTDNHKLHPITLELDRELRAWLTYYAKECGPLQPHWYLTPARWRLGRAAPLGGFDGTLTVLRPECPVGRPIRVVHQALERIGLDSEGAGFHTLRRSSARAVFDQAVADGDARAIHIAREFLDHSSVVLTEGYIGTNAEKQRLEETLRGKAFLTKRVSESTSVVNLADHRRKRRG